jgi:hypothetical protein
MKYTDPYDPSNGFALLNAKENIFKPKQIRSQILEYRNKIIESSQSWARSRKSHHGVDYKLNNVNLRCDDFKVEHSGEHILFAGCSNTYGVGTEYERTWAYEVYFDICKNKKVDGYYNLGNNGATILEIIWQVFAYIDLYGKPDTIFLLLPEIERDDAFFVYPSLYTDAVVSRNYGMLNTFCKELGIKLFSTSWVFDFPKMWDIIIEKKEPFPNKLKSDPHRNQNAMFDELSQVYPESFVVLDKAEFIADVYEYSLKNKKEENLFIAKDSGRHFGHAIHYAWKQHFLRRYNDKKVN